jgi:hypothetical protein
VLQWCSGVVLTLLSGLQGVVQSILESSRIEHLSSAAASQQVTFLVKNVFKFSKQVTAPCIVLLSHWWRPRLQTST